MPLTDKREYKLSPINLDYDDNANENLLVFENELNLENHKLKNYKNIYLILLTNEVRKIKLEKKVLDFKTQIINDQKKRLDQIKVINETELQSLAKETISFDVIHPSIGENYSYLNSLRKKLNLKLSFILNEEDKFSWQFSNKGYFNFKNNIPNILSKFKIN